MTTNFNPKGMAQRYVLEVQDITFASTEIGAATGGRSSTTTWSQNDEVVFAGNLEHVFVFAIMAFSVNGVSILETFRIVPEREYTKVKNLGDTDIIDIVSLDPADAEGIVLDDDINWTKAMTNNYRASISTKQNLIAQEKAVRTNVLHYAATMLQSLVWGHQFQDSGTAPISTLYDFALSDVGAGTNQGVVYEDIASTQHGPIEYEQALLTLANIILSA